jgi:hypothetical protein
MGVMDMSFPFELADCKRVDGQIDHHSLMATAISRQASGITARLMLHVSKEEASKRNIVQISPLNARISYFARKSHASFSSHPASGAFFVSHIGYDDQEFYKDESAVYQEASAIRKHQDSKECKSASMLDSEGQEILRQI